MRLRVISTVALASAFLAIPTPGWALSVTPTNVSAAMQAALLAGNTGLAVDAISIDHVEEHGIEAGIHVECD
jgi:hypothetical protein